MADGPNVKLIFSQEKTDQNNCIFLSLFLSPIIISYSIIIIYSVSYYFKFIIIIIIKEVHVCCIMVHVSYLSLQHMLQPRGNVLKRVGYQHLSSRQSDTHHNWRKKKKKLLISFLSSLAVIMSNCNTNTFKMLYTQCVCVCSPECWELCFCFEKGERGCRKLDFFPEPFFLDFLGGGSSPIFLDEIFLPYFIGVTIENITNAQVRAAGFLVRFSASLHHSPKTIN